MKASPRFQSAALLLGLVVGFGGAIVAGHRAAQYSKPSNFQRFHSRISPQGSFYPPFSMLEDLALARWRPGQTLVIVGGNSILYGVGQTESELWTSRLQETLGPRYAVVNLAFAGAYPGEAGALVAEAMIKRHIPTLYVANSAPGPTARPYESIYAYLYWDALYKERLLPNPLRDTEVAYRETALLPAGRRALATAQLAGRLDALLRFNALWHHVAYRHVTTVWTYLARATPWRPRALLPDDEPPAPLLTERFRDQPELEMQIVRNLPASLAEPDGHGGWQASSGSTIQTHRDIDEVFVPRLRTRMIMLLSQNALVYRDRLLPAERARDDFVYATYEKLWRAHGVACVTVESGFTATDYRDRTHLSATGGEKLARLVAAEIRRFPAP